MLDSSTTKKNSSATLGNVRLVDAPGGTRGHSLCIYNSAGRSLWSNQPWLSEGRPAELSSFNLATWSLLTSSIRDFQTALRVRTSKVYVRLLLPFYFVWFTSLFFLDMSNEITFRIHWWCLIAIIIGARLLMYYYQQKHAEEVFHPSVRAVLEELTPKFKETGFSVTLVKETGSWCWASSKSFLQFAPF